MTVLASEILERVRKQLIDENVVQRWSDAELMLWMSDAERTIVAMNPSLGERTASIPLVAGTKQSVPSGAFMLLDVKRNMGADGDTPGRAVRMVRREVLDSLDPDWHAGARSSVIQNIVYDPMQPRTFYTYPPASGTTHVEASCAYTPPEIATVSQPITVPDLYRTAIFDYVMFRAHQKDSDYAAGEGKAQVYLTLFLNFMGAHEAAKLAESPNTELAPADLTVKGTAR